MCGIIGYQASKFNKKSMAQAINFVMNRGYDSVGIQINNMIKKKIYPNHKDIEKIVNIFEDTKVKTCIAHTRWATHGNIDEKHAHPIKCGICSCVMNGQIENYEEISKNCSSLQTKCDTELIPYLINKKISSYEIEHNKEISIEELPKIINFELKKLKGDFSFALIIRGIIVLYKRGNPLHIGFSDNSIVFSSDYRVCQILDNTITHSYCLEDEEVIIIDGKNKKNCHGLIKYKIETIQERFSIEELLQLDSSKHQTEVEILRQGNFLPMNSSKNNLFLDEIRKELDNIICLGEGSSYHVAMYFEELYNSLINSKNSNYNFSKVSFSSSEIELLSSEIFKDKSILLYSQSGETKDLINILQKFTFKKIFIITNNSFSTLARKSDCIFTLNCGIEYGVAATVSFTNSLYATNMIFNKNSSFSSLNSKVFNIFKLNEIQIKKLISLSQLNQIRTGFILSSQTNMFTYESCLKISELSEILFMANNFNSLKHGLYSCIEENNTIVILDSSASSSLIHQLLSRSAIVVTINSKHTIENCINLKIGNYENKFEELFLKLVLMQKLGFEISIGKNLNPDKPKNLAKSVTVES